MYMKIREITDYLEGIAPLSLQESYDNAGLIVGDPDAEVRGALVCLDSTPEVILEAKEKGVNLVIAHHPIVFGGLKKLNGKNYVERAVILAIRHDIAIYAIHTNLDNVLEQGVNQKIAAKLGLKNLRILQPKKGLLQKLVVFAPETHVDAVREAMFVAGAGHIGNYDSCSFSSGGQGSFRGDLNTNPHVGEPGKPHLEAEQRIEVIVPAHQSAGVILAMIAAHPYEEVAYDLYELKNTWAQTGSGLVGDFPEAIEPNDFLALVKERFSTGVIRYTEPVHRQIHTVALCGGSGSFLLPDAIRSGAQVFLSSDFKYHQFFDADNRLMIADIGHYEAEYFTIELLHDLIRKKFNTFAVIFSGIHTNPIKYFC